MKIALLVLLAIVPLSSALAQSDSLKIKVVFEDHEHEGSSATKWGEKKKQYKENAIERGGATHIITFDPSHIIVGDYSLYYQYKLSYNMSVELGAGPTGRSYWNDFMYVWRNDGNYPNDFFEYADKREAKPGYSVQGRYRYFPSPYYHLDGFYIGGIVRLRKYLWNYYADNPLTGDTDTYNEKESHIDLGILFGSQTYTDAFVVDYYAGLSMHTVSGTRYQLEYNPLYGFEQAEPVSISRLVPGVLMGIKLGLAF